MPWLENIVIVLAFSYAVFEKGFSGWWWIVAIGMLNYQKSSNEK